MARITKITDQVLFHWLETTGHSIYGGSSLKKIILCPGSVLSELNSPIPPTSVYAAKGTLLHNYCEKAFTERPDNPVSYVNETSWEPEDKVLVIDALNYVLGIIALHTGKVSVGLEVEGNLSTWGLPEVLGTMDVEVKSETRIDVLDYKFGYGIQVFAQDNPQCISYLGGAVPFIQGVIPEQELHVHIVQPTLGHFDPWHVPYATLCYMILDTIAGAIAESRNEILRYNPSMEACRWCNAKDGCEWRLAELTKQSKQLVQAAKNPAVKTKEDWIRLLDAADDIQQAIKDCRAYATREIKSTRGFEGYKLVAGRSTRVFKDKVVGTDYIKTHLGDKAYKPEEVISLAQAEKVLPGLKKSQVWKDMIKKPTGKPVLVKDSDKRKALEFTMENEFAADAEIMLDVKHLRDPFAAK
ncbi:MAG: hypothetical protein DRJ15_01535 [Bacteroidetes bacterium]|nr:MAG: hypothetical protein DRH90_21045 [Deltaproteobacteria bacterium]RLD82412.1 MAG: hypothetical protein DRJ15_01535 [Bacteroidota bacterium]